MSKENNPEKNICGLCQFQAKDPKALIQHIALGTHFKKKIEFSYIFKFFYVFRNFSLATFISNFLYLYVFTILKSLQSYLQIVANCC